MRSNYIIAFATACLFACSNEDIAPLPEDLSQETTSETTPKRRITTMFRTNNMPDRIYGIYMKASDAALSSIGNIYNNVRLSELNGQYVSNEDFFWPEGNATYDFIAYSPYIPTIEEVSSVPTLVCADQSTQDAYEASDFLWGIAKGVSSDASGPSVNLQHLLSLVKVKIDVPNLDYNKLAVTLCNTCSTGFVNIANGTVNAYGETSDITCYNQHDGTFTAILVPQTLSYTHFITINYDGKEYIYNGSIELKPSVTHTLTIKSLADNEIKVAVSVQDWNLAEEVEDKCEEER